MTHDTHQIHGIVSLIVAVGTTVILFVFNIDLVLFFGLITFVLNFIPNVGSFVATILPLPFVILNPHFAVWKFFAVGFCLCALHVRPPLTRTCSSPCVVCCVSCVCVHVCRVSPVVLTWSWFIVLAVRRRPGDRAPDPG